MTNDNSSAQTGTPRKVVGEEARALLESQLAAHEGGILTGLASYRPADAVTAWHDAIRAVEEFINIPLFGIKDTHLGNWLQAIPLDVRLLSDPGPTFLTVRQFLQPIFETSVVERYLRTMSQVASISHPFQLHGQRNFGSGITLDTVGAAVVYFQSRRRHMVSLLFTMPFACKGIHSLSSIDALNVFLPLVEYNCVAITTLHLQLALMETLADFSLEVDDVGARASHGFTTLDDYFLEPERVSIMAMGELRQDQIVMPHMEQLDPRKVFSAAELRNWVRLTGATYETFGLNDSEFSTIAQLIIAFSRQARDDYFVEIGKLKFRSILRAQSLLDPTDLETLLVHVNAGYGVSSNTYKPFIDMGDVLISNVNLLSRFLYAFKNAHLTSRRRYDDVIYNFQCKNNWIDLARVDSDRPLFNRYNRSLTNYYRRALQKELKRESLLKSKLGLTKVEHYLISRFPVIGADNRVINYNQIDRLKKFVKGHP